MRNRKSIFADLIIGIVCVSLISCSNLNSNQFECDSLSRVSDVMIESLPRDMMTRMSISPADFLRYKQMTNKRQLRLNEEQVVRIVEACKSSSIKEANTGIDIRCRFRFKLKSGEAKEVFINRTGKDIWCNGSQNEISGPLAELLVQMAWPPT